MYCNLNDRNNDWNAVIKEQVGVNCSYHIPSCYSKSRNAPMKFLKAQMGGVITDADSLSSRKVTKTIKDTPNLKINGAF